MAKNSPSCLVCGHHQKLLFDYRRFKYFRCQSCGLVSTLPLPTETQITEHYQNKFKQGNYLLLRQYAPAYMKVYRDMAQRLDHYLQTVGQAFSTAKLLDIGTFTADFLQAADELGADVYGTELQADAVKIANQKFPGKISQADVLSTKFPSKKFDLITMLGLIEHLPNPDQMIRRVTKLIRPGGVMMIQTPDSSSFLARTLGKWWPPYAPIEHIHLFSRRSLYLLLSQAGFSHIQIQHHVKRLPIDYVYQNMQNFGPEFHRILKPISHIFSKSKLSLTLYGGEMIVLAQKPPTPNPSSRSKS